MFTRLVHSDFTNIVFKSEDSLSEQNWLSGCFSGLGYTQTDDGAPQVRRGEDWRRSRHDATTQMCGGRVRHHTVDDIVFAARTMHKLRDLHVWVTIMNHRTDICLSGDVGSLSS